MKFDELDASLRAFEAVHDRRIPSGVQIVARLDGRSFSRLTKELMDYDAPYDERFRDIFPLENGRREQELSELACLLDLAEKRYIRRRSHSDDFWAIKSAKA